VVTGERAHLSIGEVLSLLQDEFPDVTISKIRFLESQGLLDPERTPSGYRKFYPSDVRRLRWILTEQRDKFLPLKVIKDRLDEGIEAELAAPDPSGNGAAAAIPPGAAPDDATLGGPGPGPGPAVSDGGAGAPPADPSPPDPTAPAAASAAPDAPAPDPDEAPQLPIWMADAARAKADRGRAGRGLDVGDGPDPLAESPSDVSLTVDEVLAASGLAPSQLASLQEYGLVSGSSLGADTFFDGEDLVIAQKAAGFLSHGVEARHLRMFKTAAEREAALLEQLVLPLSRQRTPEGRQEARETLAELAGLGQGLRAALLRVALADHR
jgi:DNA-binding transcriptional MerR regulator